jgi:hypothetical protein
MNRPVSMTPMTATTAVRSERSIRLAPFPEPNRVANPRRAVNQRLREFRTEILGCRRNRGGFLRTLVAIS